jgi:hypothetical protein
LPLAKTILTAKIYPPKTDNALKQLHQQVCEANMSTHHKFSIFYYILLDFDRTSGRDNVSDAFVDASGMPKKYQIFMKGLWYLDHRDFSVSFATALAGTTTDNVLTESAGVHLAPFSYTRLCR